MARSAFPPIVWDASCGHRNQVRSDTGGYATNCKACGAKVWVPKRGAGRAPSAREAAGRFGPRRSASRRTGRESDRPSRHVAEAEDRAGDQTSLAQMLENIDRLAHRLAVPPDGRVLTGTPIPPSRLAVPQPARPKPTLTIRPEPAPVRREEPVPGFGAHTVPDAGPWCQVCSFMGWRNGAGRFARATVALEMLRDGRLLVCGNCATRIRKRFPAEIVRDRKLPGQPGPPGRGTVYRAVPYPQPDPVPRAVVPSGQPNETIEISGRGREGQLALAQAARLPVSRRAGNSARCSCRGYRAGPGHQPGCVFS